MTTREESNSTSLPVASLARTAARSEPVSRPLGLTEMCALFVVVLLVLSDHLAERIHFVLLLIILLDDRSETMWVVISVLSIRLLPRWKSNYQMNAATKITIATRSRA